MYHFRLEVSNVFGSFRETALRTHGRSVFKTLLREIAMKIRRYTILAAALVMAFSGLVAAPVFAGEVTLSGASCFPIGSPPGRPFEALVKEINKRGKGVVQIDLKGGRVVIAPPDGLLEMAAAGLPPEDGGDG